MLHNFVKIMQRRAGMLAAMCVMMLALAAPAFAQTNPFTSAASEVQTYIGYGLGIGAVALGVIVGIRVGKTIFRALSS